MDRTRDDRFVHCPDGARTTPAPPKSDGMTPRVAIKLVDPHPNLPNQLLPRNINNAGEIVGHIGDERDGTGFMLRRERPIHGIFVSATMWFFRQSLQLPHGNK